MAKTRTKRFLLTCTVAETTVDGKPFTDGYVEHEVNEAIDHGIAMSESVEGWDVEAMPDNDVHDPTSTFRWRCEQAARIVQALMGNATYPEHTTDYRVENVVSLAVRIVQMIEAEMQEAHSNG